MIKEKIEELLDLTAIDLGLYQFELDPLGHKVPLAEKLELIEESISCGQEVAQQLVIEYGSQSLEDYLNLMALKLVRKDTNSGLEYVYFGTYQKSNVITVYDENISKGADYINSLALSTIQASRFSEAVIAHELFHHIETHDKNLFVNQVKIPLWQLGKFKYQSPLIAPAEIASMAFAKELLGLNFEPNVLDVLLLLPEKKELAEEIYQNMLAVKVSERKSEV